MEEAKFLLKAKNLSSTHGALPVISSIYVLKIFGVYYGAAL